MRMIEIDYDAQPPIDGYGPGGFRVDGTWLEGGLIMMAGGPQPLDGAPSVGSLAAVMAAADTLDVLLIGQGADIAPLDRTLKAALEHAGIGFEIMSTPSACRTYNVLLTENRRVAAALVPV